MSNYPLLNFDRMQGYPLQEDIIQSEARFKIVAIGRQAGKSWMAKRIALEKAANEGKRVWWIAPAIPIAQSHWEDLLAMILRIEFPVKKISVALKQIEFQSGGSIRIRSAEIPDNLRGGTLDYIIMDEAAFMVGEVWYKVLQATISASRGQVLMLSTPNGRNWFYDVYLNHQRGLQGWHSWNAPSTISPYQDKELLEQIRLTSPRHVWEQEYLAMFIEDSGGVFIKVASASTGLGLNAPVRGQVYVAGIDWGGVNDPTVLVVLDKYKREQVYAKILQGMDNDDQIDRLVELLDLWHPEVTAIERNGVGEPMFNMLKKRMAAGSTKFYVDDRIFNQDSTENIIRGMYPDEDHRGEAHVLVGGHQARGYSMSNPFKRKIIETLATDIEFGRLTLLSEEAPGLHVEYARQQIAEMSTFQRKKTESGLNTTYAAAEGYHDDTVMALALAYELVPKWRGDRFFMPLQKTKKRPMRTKKANPFRR